MKVLKSTSKYWHICLTLNECKLLVKYLLDRPFTSKERVAFRELRGDILENFIESPLRKYESNRS